MHCTPGKEAMYREVLDKWITESKFDIFTVDTANSSTFAQSNHPRWKACSFKKREKDFEVINNAEERFGWNEFDLVIKLSGLYFLPGLEKASSCIPKSTVMVVQHRSSFYTCSQNSELLAFKPGYSSLLLNSHKTDRQKLYDVSLSLDNCLRFPKFYNLLSFPDDKGIIFKTL
jgi:hypothetical protein